MKREKWCNTPEAGGCLGWRLSRLEVHLEAGGSSRGRTSEALAKQVEVEAQPPPKHLIKAPLY